MVVDLLMRPSIRYLVGPGLIAFGAQIEPLVGRVPVLAAGWVLVAASSWQADRALGREDGRHSLTLLLQNAVTIFEAARSDVAERTLRANLMLVDDGGDALWIAYATVGYDASERSLSWHRGQGCAGVAWESGETVYAPYEDELPVFTGDADLASRPWNMTRDQILLTAEKIASIISVPVFLPEEPAMIVGVLNLDDSRPLDESLLAEPVVHAAVEELARSAGSLLERAGLEFPPALGDDVGEI
jgi:GAF domain-containing protein